MGEPRGDPDLPQKAARLVASAGTLPQHLERDLPAVLEILRQIDAGRAPAPDLLLQPVPAGQDGGGGMEQVGEVGHDLKSSSDAPAAGAPAATVLSYQNRQEAAVGN